MAAVLYDPAFAVLTTWFSSKRRRALTFLTLVAGLARTIFVPLSSWLLVHLGWRPALAALAVVLLLITVPLHALVLRHRPADLGLVPDGEAQSAAGNQSPSPVTADHLPGAVMRSASFWLLTAAFVLSSGVSVAAGVHFIPYLLEHGHSAAIAAGLAGAIGLMHGPAASSLRH
jgi:sugar phosphate permease